MHRAIAFGVLALGWMTAHAGENAGPTFGLGAGYAHHSLNEGFSGSDDTIAWQAFAGWRFNRYVALEAMYEDAGSVDTRVLGVPVRLDGKAYGASVLGSLPLGDGGLALTLRGGYVKGEITARVAGQRIRDDDSTPIFGAGIRTMLDGAQVRLEYQRADFELIDSSAVMLSVAWLF